MPAQTPVTLTPNFLGYCVDEGRLRLHKIIGSGAYGVVYKATDLKSSQSHPTQYAVKCLNKVPGQSRLQRREMTLQKLACNHPGIITVHHVFEEYNCIFIVLDYCQDGDLFAMITEHHRYFGCDTLIKQVFLQILDAVGHCHDMGIFHRDLKPENILCSNGGARLLLADFGLATTERVSQEFGCGSSFYMSPECWGGIFTRVPSYSTRSNDIWALGVILVNLTCGRNPWMQASTSDDLFCSYLRNPEFLQTILPISNQTHDILKRIFTCNPDNRITLPELKEAIKGVVSFRMSSEELRDATDACKATALAAPTAVRRVRVNPRTPIPRIRVIDIQTLVGEEEHNLQTPPPSTADMPHSDGSALTLTDQSAPATPEMAAANASEVDEEFTLVEKESMPTTPHQFLRLFKKLRI